VNRSTRHLLFLCSRNRLRSPTAEAIFASCGTKTDSAGLSPDAEVILSPDQIEWADLILVMEKIHLARLNRDYGRYLKSKRVVVLGIPDRYDFMDPALIAVLEERCARYVS
jgi:predicted protein tyrosine phosphatase